MNLNIIKYNCSKCGKLVTINNSNLSSENKNKVIEKCFDNKICLSCHCASSKSIKETAENIVALMCE